GQIPLPLLVADDMGDIDIPRPSNGIRYQYTFHGVGISTQDTETFQYSLISQDPSTPTTNMSSVISKRWQRRSSANYQYFTTFYCLAASLAW
ncbi:hypothetical protein J6590_048804, partial [Homalodisca vitripennis]